MRTVKRIGFVLAFAFALAFSGTLIQSSVAPKTAGACGWYVAGYGNVASTQTYDNSQGKYTYVNFQAQSLLDGCGAGQGRIHIWTNDGSAVSVTAYVREWVNGGYFGFRTATGSSSNAYYYGFAYTGVSSLGVDDLNSTASNASFAPNPVGGYTHV